MSSYGKLNFLPMTSIYLVFSYLEIERTLEQTKVYNKIFYSVWKEMFHKPLKVAAAKSLSQVYFFIMIYKYTCNTHNNWRIIKNYNKIRLEHTKTRSIQTGVCLVELRNLPELKQFWKIISGGLHIEMPQSFIMRMLIMSWPWASLGSRFLTISYIFFSKKQSYLKCY